MGDAEPAGEDQSGKGGVGMNIRARIRAVGDPDWRRSRAGKTVYRVDCAGCGEDIWSDQDLSGIQYVKTKRGTDLFIHDECVSRVWGGMKANGKTDRKGR